MVWDFFLTAGGGNSTSVNIDNLQAGVYVVVLKNNAILVVQEKLVVE